MSGDTQPGLAPDQLRAKAEHVLAVLRTDPELTGRFQQDPIAVVTSLGLPEYAAGEFVREVGPALHADVQAYAVCRPSSCQITSMTIVTTTAIDPIDDGEEGEVITV
jgi:hypothetical protein